ncbi:MAG: PDZ domain-containing protein [Rubripirellula sp.]
MFRRLSLLGVAFLVATSFLIVDSNDTNAQGLLRRIRDRVQSRAPQPQPQTRQPQAQRPAQTQRPAASNASNGRSPVQLQRVSPVKPGQRPGGPTLAAPINPNQSKANQARPGAATDPSASRQNPNSATAKAVPGQTPNPRLVNPAAPNLSRTAPGASAESKSFGGSILSSPGTRPTPAKPAQAEKPAPATNSANRRNLDATPIPSPVAEITGTPISRISEPSLNQPTLGIEVLESNNGVPGLRVVRFREHSECQQAGLKLDDVIVAVNGNSTPTVAAIAKAINGATSNQVRARIVRGRTTEALMLPLISKQVAATTQSAKAPITATAATGGQFDLGLDVEEKRGVRGVIVQEVATNSPAAAAGLKPGDRVISVDGKILISQASYDREIANHGAGDEVMLQVVREGKLISTDIKFTDPGNIAKADAPAKAKQEPSSLLSGVGSALGGLFGSSKATAAQETEQIEDEMAFGDDEPVKPVGYESEIQRKLDGLRKETSKTDQPKKKGSLDSFLDLPTDEITELRAPTPEKDAKPVADSDVDDAEAIREQIRRLNERLKKIESDN